MTFTTSSSTAHWRNCQIGVHAQAPRRGGSDVDERSSASVSSDLKALYKSVIIIIIIIIIIYHVIGE